MIEMKVAGIALDAITRSPIVLLKDASDRRALPIYIGQEQARAIMSALENQKPPQTLNPRSDCEYFRDMEHDSRAGDHSFPAKGYILCSFDCPARRCQKRN